MWYDRVMISIHALLAESDKGVPRKEFVEQLFLSTLSLRRATCFSMLSRYRMQAFLSTLSLRRATDRGHKVCNVFAISIHALLAESDQVFSGSVTESEDFYPRSPCGERRTLCW